jgi:hypothetical protein
MHQDACCEVTLRHVEQQHDSLARFGDVDLRCLGERSVSDGGNTGAGPCIPEYLSMYVF